MRRGAAFLQARSRRGGRDGGVCVGGWEGSGDAEAEWEGEGEVEVEVIARVLGGREGVGGVAGVWD